MKVQPSNNPTRISPAVELPLGELTQKNLTAKDKAEAQTVSPRLEETKANALRAPSINMCLGDIANPQSSNEGEDDGEFAPRLSPNSSLVDLAQSDVASVKFNRALAADAVAPEALGQALCRRSPSPTPSEKSTRSRVSHAGRQVLSEQALRRKEHHGHRGALRKVLAALFHQHRMGTGTTLEAGWSMDVSPGTLHDPKEAELVIDPVGQREDKRATQSPNTTIVGKAGNRYQLLNSLTPRQEQILGSLLDACEPEEEDFVNGRLKVILGKGAFGSVRLAINEHTQKLVAVKKMLPEFGLEEVKKFEMLNALPEETRSTIINMEDYAVVPGKNGKLKAYLFEELMNHGDLGDYDNAAILDLPNTELERLDLAFHILELVQNIHDHHTYHRDLKPDNLLRTTEGTIKLGDVGSMSQELYPIDGGGTLPFLPPEYGQPRARADLADAFAIGVMFYQLLGFEHPNKDYPPAELPANKDQLMDNYHLAKDARFIEVCDTARDANNAGNCSLHSVAHQLMHPNPAKRLNVREATEMVHQLMDRARERQKHQRIKYNSA